MFGLWALYKPKNSKYTTQCRRTNVIIYGTTFQNLGFKINAINRMTVEILKYITEAEVALYKYYTYVVWCFGMSLLATGTEVAIPACV